MAGSRQTPRRKTSEALRVGRVSGFLPRRHFHRELPAFIRYEGSASIEASRLDGHRNTMTRPMVPVKT
jgi:hypothetical protein